jgi:hypothetical protein
MCEAGMAIRLRTGRALSGSYGERRVDALLEGGYFPHEAAGDGGMVALGHSHPDRSIVRREARLFRRDEGFEGAQSPGQIGRASGRQMLEAIGERLERGRHAVIEVTHGLRHRSGQDGKPGATRCRIRARRATNTACVCTVSRLTHSRSVSARSASGSRVDSADSRSAAASSVHTEDRNRTAQWS